MTAKTPESLTERLKQYAKKKGQEGACASVGGQVAQGTEKPMLEEWKREATLPGMATAIRERMATPRSVFVEVGENDSVLSIYGNEYVLVDALISHRSSSPCHR